jgi:hypothetical protein
MITRNGIYYDLNKSTFKFKTPDTKMTFVFSSDLHMIKFEDQYTQNRIEQNIKLTARFRFNIKTTVLPDLLLYKKIETRGFLVFNERGQKLCQESLILTGEQATPKD